MTRTAEKLLWAVIVLQLIVIAYLLVFSWQLSSRLDVALLSRPAWSSPSQIVELQPTGQSIDVQQLRVWWQQDLAEALAAHNQPLINAADSPTRESSDLPAADLRTPFDFSELDNQLADLLSDGLYSNVDMGQIESAIAELPPQHRQKAMNRVMRKLSTENIVISQ